MTPLSPSTKHGRVVELFAGVGGFGLGLEQTGCWEVVWANQWEPSTKKQHAFECLAENSKPGVETVCQDVAVVLDEVEQGCRQIPPHDLVVGGFPCQDYSVATTQAEGIQGKKGVLWWQIYRFLTLYRTRFVVLENVDRLLNSPADRRGRDFAIILACLAELGYFVEWRVLNAADYGFPQKRRRVFIVAVRDQESLRGRNLFACLVRDGVLAKAFPVKAVEGGLYSGVDAADFSIPGNPSTVSATFGSQSGKSPFENGGVMSRGRIVTRRLDPEYHGPRRLLRDCLVPDDQVPQEYYVDESQLDVWRHLKGAKREPRYHRGSDTPYFYVEGAIPFPDPTDCPSRTIMTAEGGRTPSRFKHLVQAADGRYRRLTAVELERLNGFPDGWTRRLTDGRRAFCMGNALVVGVVTRIGEQLAELADNLEARHVDSLGAPSGANLGGRFPLHEGKRGEEHQTRNAAKG